MVIDEDDKIYVNLSIIPDYNGCLPLIISAKTGVFYEAQVGGLGCHHPEFEGVFMLVDGRFKVIDDCKEGLCFQEMDIDMSEQEKLLKTNVGKMIDEKLNELNLSGWFLDKIIIDFDRIHLLTEGWWPVKYRMKNFNERDCHESYKWVEAILYTGNCD